MNLTFTKTITKRIIQAVRNAFLVAFFMFFMINAFAQGATTSGPTLVISSDELFELTLDGAEVLVEIQNDSFIDDQFDIANFTLSNGALSTISIATVVAEGDAALVTLAYTPVDFDENFTEFSITVSENEITGGMALVSNSLTVLANIEDQVSADFSLNSLETSLLGNVQIPGELPLFDQGAAEISAFHPESNRVFITNGRDNVISILNISDPANPAFENSIDLSGFAGGGGPNSVAVFDGEVDLVAVAIENANTQANGVIALFNANTLAPVGPPEGITAGALPDFVTFNEDGTKLVVANEGEPNADLSIDPEGSIAIIDLTDLGAPVVTTADFNAFDSQEADLVSSGVRIFTPSSTEEDGTATVSQDLEPEFITIDGNIAYVSCQENNAIAVVDISSSAVTNIFPLGLKDHSEAGKGLDASNRDDQINIANWPVFGMYQPDAIAFHNGFILTANEGDGREYDTFEEVERIGNFNLDPVAFPNADLLQQNEALGRLEATLSNGDTDRDGDYDQLWSFGARSFSVWDPSSGTGIDLRFDSGNDLEQIVKTRNPNNFNSTDDENNFENRSDDAGPEPEGITVGQVDGTFYAFIGLERDGGIVAYDLTNTTSPAFAAYFSNRDFSVDFPLDEDNVTNEEIATVGDLSPEGLTFVSAADSPTGQELLIISNEVSGSISIWGLGSAINEAEPARLVAESDELIEIILNESEIELTLENTAIVETGINIENFNLNNAPSGLTIVRAELGEENTLDLILAFDGTDFDEDITNLSITISAAQLTGGEELTSNDLLILANIEDAARQDFTQDVLSTEVLGSVQIPGDAPLFDEGAAEISVYHPESNRVFITNGRDNVLNVLNISNPASPTFEEPIDLSSYAEGGGPNSVAVFDGEVDLIAVAIENDNTQDNGVIALFDANTLAPVGPPEGITAGALPDFVTFNEDGTKIVVANEGEPSDDLSVNPEGSVTIITVNDMSNITTVQANFNAFDAQENALRTNGVRIFTPSATEEDGTATVSQDMEPEFITIDGNTAYVSCQENNAVAVLNLVTNTIENIFALGVKDHSLAGQGLDASNRDDQINIANWPVFGMYQPDAITFYNGFILSANEGDGREYETEIDGEEITVYSEVERIGDFNLDSEAFPNASLLQENEALGRLEATLANGDIDGDGDYDQLWSFGARSFSVWDPSSGTGIDLRFDSGNDLEQIVKTRNPENFNTTNDENAFENRSDDAGPEPEGITVGEVNGRAFAFIGLERESGIVAYDITNTTTPTFAAYFSNRNFEVDPDDTETNAELLEAGDLGPEGLVFVSAENSPTRQSLLIVSNEVSGTLTIWGVGEAVAAAAVNLTASEENPSEGAVITLTATSSLPVLDNQTVDVTVTGIEAVDFELSANEITIENGETIGTVTLTLVDDSDFEEETAIVSISNPSEGLIIGGASVSIVIDDSADEVVTGIAEELLSSIKIYPVPASEIIQIESTQQTLNLIELISIAGHKVLTVKPLQNKVALDITDIETGIYLLRMTSSDSTTKVTKRIIINR